LRIGISSLLIRILSADDESGMPVFPKPQYGNGGPPSCTVHRRSVAEKIRGWNDYRDLVIPSEADFFNRASAAGFTAIFVPRLTAIKFPGSNRKNVYRDKPSHEQAHWFRRMSEPDFEAEHLVHMIEALSAEVASNGQTPHRFLQAFRSCIRDDVSAIDRRDPDRRRTRLLLPEARDY
jgi:hypothetical protein